MEKAVSRRKAAGLLTGGRFQTHNSGPVIDRVGARPNHPIRVLEEQLDLSAQAIRVHGVIRVHAEEEVAAS
jgi:hypothetical protein